MQTTVFWVLEYDATASLGLKYRRRCAVMLNSGITHSGVQPGL